MQIQAAVKMPMLLKSPICPTPKQCEFLLLDDDEALYGGSAGCGKSEMLLMWLAEGITVPSYQGCIIRRTYPQLMDGVDSIYGKSKGMFPSFGGQWSAQHKSWVFPSGAQIQLAFCSDDSHLDNFQGKGYHRVAWDELTQFPEHHYLYLFSRIRHAESFPIATGMRGASNPGGRGHVWVKNRFVSENAMEFTRLHPVDSPSPFGAIFYKESKPFLPARLVDNPFVDIDDYRRKLAYLDDITRARLENGDWSVTEGAILNPADFRYYQKRQLGTHLCLAAFDGDGREIGDPIATTHMQRFITIDTAMGTKEVEFELRGDKHSYHVAAIWDYAGKHGELLFLRHVYRSQVAVPDLINDLLGLVTDWEPENVFLEDASMSRAVVPFLRQRIKAIIDNINTTKDEAARLRRVEISYLSPQNITEKGPGTAGLTAKVERSVALQAKLRKHQVFWPQYETTFLPDFTGELIIWSGDKKDSDDQVDVASYAARVAEGLNANVHDSDIPGPAFYKPSRMMGNSFA